MTKYLNFFESESGFTEAVEAGQLFYPNVSYTEDNDTVHWNLGRSVETPMLRMHFSTSSPGEEVKLHRNSGAGNAYSGSITALEIDGTPVNLSSGGNYSIAEPGNHTAVYQFASPAIPERLFRSDSGAFDTFTSAEITSAVTTVSAHAFSNCSGLSSVTIPDSVNTIGNGAFNSCSSLQYVVLPDNLTVIEDFAFTSCSSLQSVVLPDNLTVIKNSAFFGCGSLHEVYIPSGVTSIGVQAFYLCSGLTAIYFYSQVPPTLGGGALDQTAFTSATDCPIYVPAEAVETYKSAWPKYAYRIKTKYNITASVNDEDKGEVMLYQETAPEGDQVEFDVNVFDSDANQVSSVTITDGNGDAVEYTDEDYGGGTLHYQFTMPASDVSVSVVIEEKPEGQYKISTALNDDSLGQVNLDQETASEGDHVGFHVDVFEMDRYQVSSVSITDGNGDEVEYEGDEYDYYFTMPASDVTISVVLEEKPEGQHRISASVNDDSLGQVNVQETASEGEPVFVNVSVNDGCRVASLVITDAGGNELEHTDFELGHYDCYFDMPASDVTIFATLEEKPIGQYHISVDLNDGSQGEVSLFKETAQETANEGDTVRLQVNVFDPENYRVGLVSVTDGNGDKVQVTNEHYDNYYRFTMPASDVTIRVVMVARVKQ